MQSNRIIRIGTCDVVLQDYEDGRGKLILSDDDRDHNVSYYWSCMGEGYDLSKFIQKVGISYLIGKLGQRDSDGPIDIKKTMRNVRKHIREYTDWKYWMDIEADKELRSELNDIQNECRDKNHFVDLMLNFEPFADMGSSTHQTDWEDMISQLQCEPWSFIETETPEVNAWLNGFLPKLQSYLKKESEATHA